MSAREQEWQDDEQRDPSTEQRAGNEQSHDLGQTARYEDGSLQDDELEDDDEGDA